MLSKVQLIVVLTITIITINKSYGVNGLCTSGLSTGRLGGGLSSGVHNTIQNKIFPKSSLRNPSKIITTPTTQFGRTTTTLASTLASTSASTLRNRRNRRKR